MDVQQVRCARRRDLGEPVRLRSRRRPATWVIP